MISIVTLMAADGCRLLLRSTAVEIVSLGNVDYNDDIMTARQFAKYVAYIRSCEGMVGAVQLPLSHG